MATLVQSLPESPRPFVWFRELLKEELAPRPGRAAMTARMVIATTLVMIISMTFRIPYGAYGAIYAVTISRESTAATVQAVRTIIIAFAAAAAVVLAGAIAFLDDPMLRFLWVIGILFVMFYAMSAMTNYSAATRFGYLVVITIPLWDRHIPAELRVEDTLWAVGAITLGSVITAAVELVYAEFMPGDELVRSIAERLASVEELLGCYVANGPVDRNTEEKITRLAARGTSRLRRILRQSSYPLRYREQMSALVALVGRLVDIAANLILLPIDIPDNARERLRVLTGSVGRIRSDLLSGKTPRRMGFKDDAPLALPLLGEIEKIVFLTAGLKVLNR
jgi:multidrug resistance protein MdtO